jgi:hypothetical protein
MKSVTRAVLVFALVAVTSVSFGEDAEKKGKKKGPREPQAIAAVKKSLAKVELSEEQSAKIEKLFAGAKEELAKNNAAQTELIGKGSGAKVQAARKKATADGLKGKAVQAAIKEALGLDDEKFAKYTENAKKNRQFAQKLRKEVTAVLTPEQNEVAGLNKKRGKGIGAARTSKKIPNTKKAKGADAKVPTLKDPKAGGDGADAKVPTLKDPKAEGGADAKVPTLKDPEAAGAKKTKKTKKAKKTEKKDDDK